MTENRRERVLRPSRLKVLLYGLLCLAFASGGVWGIASQGGIVPWFVALVFGLGAVVFAVQLMPNASYVRLTSEGFIVRSLFRRWPLLRWESVSEFRVAAVPGTGINKVVFDWYEAPKPRLRKLNRELVGAGEMLPDNYGLTPDELAELMNGWRAGRRTASAAQ